MCQITLNVQPSRIEYDMQKVMHCICHKVTTSYAGNTLKGAGLTQKIDFLYEEEQIVATDCNRYLWGLGL